MALTVVMLLDMPPGACWACLIHAQITLASTHGGESHNIFQDYACCYVLFMHMPCDFLTPETLCEPFRGPLVDA